MNKANLKTILLTMALTLFLMTGSALGEGDDALVVDEYGNVGIGTSNPGSKLEVNGTTTIQGTLTGNASANIFGPGGTGSNTADVQIKSQNNGTSRLSFYGDITPRAFIQYNVPDEALQFLFTGSLTEKMRLTSSGNLGIGTTNPGATLDVNGTTYIRGGLIGPWASSGISWATAANIQVAEFQSGTGYTSNILALKTDTASGSGFDFLECQSPGGVIPCRIRGDGQAYFAGNVGIGTTSPSSKLHVAGTITEDSDERLKENIKPIDSALNKVAMLRGVAFEWKDKKNHDNRTHLGVIAQDVEPIFPELVFSAIDKDGTKAVNYNGLVAPLIEAVKELKAQNEALKARLEALESK